MDILTYLKKYDLPPILHERLRNHLTNVAKRIGHLNHVQLQQGLAKPLVICSVSQDDLLFTDDKTPTTLHMTINFDGVTIHGNAVKCISYPSAGTTLQSAAILGNVFYFSAQGSLYRCPLETKASELVVDNSTNNSAFNLNKISVFRKSTVFTDPDDHQVEEYNPETKAVTNIIGSSQERSSDGSEKSASLIQVHGICTYEKSLFVTDVAAGTIKLVTGFLKPAPITETTEQSEQPEHTPANDEL